MGKPAFYEGVFHAESNKTPSCNLLEKLLNDVSLTYAKKGAVSNIDIEFWGGSILVKIVQLQFQMACIRVIIYPNCSLLYR